MTSDAARRGGDVRGLSHPERRLWDEPALTKQDLADYFVAVAPWMLPQIRGRPLTLVRRPRGPGGRRFFQRHMPSAPAALRRVMVPDAPGAAESGASEYLAVEDRGGLLALAQIGALEIHVWGARAEALETPDRLVLDLDPGPGASWPAVCDAARDVRRRLDALGLASFVKTTGGAGLHVVAPLAPLYGWDLAKNLSAALARAMADEAPNRYVATMAKAKRAERVFVDYLRNVRSASWIAPFSPRARPGAFVSAPLAWDELDGATPDRFDLRSMPKRLSTLESDPWAGADAPQKLSARALALAQSP